MAVTPSDLKLFKTSNNLGGAITATQASGGNVYDAFTGDETAAGTTEYACVYVQNDSAQTAFSVGVYVNSETSHAGANAAIGLGSSAVNGTEQTVANKNAAPAGVSFSEANGDANALSIGDIPAGHHKAVWIRMVIGAGTAAKNNYTIQIGIKADTGE